jgi:glycosyltransferase involved in cell wall biosynthesis
MTLCFIIAPQNKSTILDRIAHEIGKVFDSPIYHYGPENLPKADHYFVTHYSMLPIVMAQVNPEATPVTCFFTHDKGNLPFFVDQFNMCHAVIAESPEGEELLRKIGVDDEHLHFVAEGGDNEAFKPHQRTDDGAILVCGVNYEDGRKNPELIKRVIDLLPKRTFEIIGNNWESVLEPKDNIIYHKDLDYKNYWGIYGIGSVYLSCSKLEGGGPNSLIEAMHANLIPVVSDTGNARQYIQHGYNGFIFPLDASAEHVASLIERAYKFRPQDQLPFNDVWRTVTQYTWANYAIQMKEIITGNYATTLNQGEYAFKPENIKVTEA